MQIALKNTRNVYPCFAPPLSVEDEKLLALEYNNYDILKAICVHVYGKAL